jgi:hypothetical protein
MHLLDEVLLEDSPEILAAAQETISNLPLTASRDNYVKCQMFFSWRAQKSLKTDGKYYVGFFFGKGNTVESR